MLRKKIAAAIGWALVLSTPAAAASLTASINLSSQTMTVAEGGEVVASWPISSGTAQFPTPRGTFRPHRTEKMWYSRKYEMSPMPNSVFINGGVAVHGTSYVKSLGRPASHGCIRLHPSHAAQFYAMVKRHGLASTKVTVFGTPKWGGSQYAKRKTPQRYASQNWFNDDYGYESSSAYAPSFTKKKSSLKRKKVYVQDQWFW